MFGVVDNVRVAAAGEVTCLTFALVLVLKFGVTSVGAGHGVGRPGAVSPPATMHWASPLGDTGIVLVPPSHVTPANVTAPASVPTAGVTMFTAATNDTPWPVIDGLIDDVTAVVVGRRR